MSPKAHQNIEAKLIERYGRNALKKANKLIKKGDLLSCLAMPAGDLKALFKDAKTNAYHRVTTNLSLNPEKSGSGRKKSKLDDHQIAALLSYSNHVLGKQSAKSDEPAPYQGLKSTPLSESAETAMSPPQAEVHIKTTYSFPHVPSKWERFSILLILRLGEKSYTGNLGNIRQLYFGKSFVATLKLSHFSLQDRQIIRYLAVNAEGDGRNLTLDAEQTAEFFHCLPTFTRFELNGERINVHSTPAEPVLVCEKRGNQRFLRPALAINDALLPIRAAKIIAGRSGCWVGMNGEYWWIPGTADIQWMRNLLRSDEQECPPEKYQRLVANKSLAPVRIIDDHVPKSLRKSKCAVLLDMTRDENDQRFVLDLSFNYEADIYFPDHLRLIQTHGHFWKRDDELERSLTNQLLCLGFERVKNASGKFAIEDSEAAALFLDEGLASWRANHAPVYLSDRLAAMRGGGEAIAPLTLRCQITAETDATYDLRYQLGTTHTAFSWHDLTERVADGAQFLFAEGRFARISDDLAEFTQAVADVVATPAGKDDILRISRSDAPFWVEAAGNLESVVPPPLRTLRDQLNLAETPTDDAAPVKRRAAFHGELRNYQKSGLNWMKQLASLGFNGVLADEMGLGKTVQALALLNESANGSNESRQPSLIICPTSLVENWAREAQRFTPELKVSRVKGQHRKKIWDSCADHDLIICSYALVRRDAAHVKTTRFHFLILDEAQHIKNPGTANAKTCKTIKADHRLVLTGTPLENRTEDVWSIFDFLNPGMLGSFKTFQKEYGGNKVDKRRQRLLAMRVSPFLLRRRKKDVCAELPPKYTQELHCEMDDAQRALYDALLEHGRDQLKTLAKINDGKLKIQLLATLTRLRQICCHPNLIPEDMRDGSVESAKMDLLQEVLSETIDAGHKALVFSQFTSLLKIVRQWLDENEIAYEYLDGSTTNRMERVDRFNSDKTIPLFLLSLKAGGVGLNLTGADTVILYDPWWNPAVEDQAADRSHRIGQKNPVHCMKLVVRDSIEERVLKLQRRKQELFNNLVENPAASSTNVNLDDLKFILEG